LRDSAMYLPLYVWPVLAILALLITVLLMAT
jgi:hypothetical protein